LSEGVLWDGRLVSIDGVSVTPPASHGGPSWATLNAGDYAVRRTPWIRQVMLHTTKGLWPQSVLPGAGDPGRAQSVADFWRSDPTHSSAPLVVDLDGSVACLADLKRTAPYHAEASNDWSIGIEMYQQADGSLFQATIEAAALLALALCHLAGIPESIPAGPYRNHPIARMETGTGATRRQTGGADLCGIFGHRDNTERRGRGDPGDAIFEELAALGCERIDFEANEDLLVGKARQTALVRHGERLAVDGVCGPASIAAMKRQGFARWRDVT